MIKHMLLLAICTVGVSGCSFFQPAQEETPTLEKTTSDSPAGQQFTTATEQITEAVSSGSSLKCTVTADAQPTSTYMIKGKKMKMLTEPDPVTQQQMFSINDGKTIYYWSSDTSLPGTKIDLEKLEAQSQAIGNDFQQFPDIRDPDVQEEVTNSNQKITCTPETISDLEFSPPSEIKFNEFLELYGDQIER